MKNINIKIIYIIISTIITISLLYIVDQILMLNYVTKIGAKFFLFMIFPIIYILMAKENFLKESIKNRGKIKKIDLSVIIGIVVFLLIIIAYLILKQFIDVNLLVDEFESKYEINKSNIVFYGLYLTFVNSLLEEFFFRGFIFLNLKKLNFRKTAYFASSAAFAIYHIANFKNWFSIELFIFVIMGLFIGGYIFNYLDDKQNTFLNSWFVHICADLAIVIIGFRIFGVL